LKILFAEMGAGASRVLQINMLRGSTDFYLFIVLYFCFWIVFFFFFGVATHAYSLITINLFDYTVFLC